MTMISELFSSARDGKVNDVVRYLEEGRCHIDAKDKVNIHILFLISMVLFQNL